MTTAFKNWMTDAYLEGRVQDIPAEHLAQAKDLAERRNKAPLEIKVIVKPAHASEELDRFEDDGGK